MSGGWGWFLAKEGALDMFICIVQELKLLLGLVVGESCLLCLMFIRVINATESSESDFDFSLCDVSGYTETF